MDCHFLLQEIFLNHILNPHLLHWQANSLPLILPEKPHIVKYLCFQQLLDLKTVKKHLLKIVNTSKIEKNYYYYFANIRFNNHTCCMYVLVMHSCPSLCDPTDCSSSDFSVYGFYGKNTGVGSHSLLQGIFPTLGLNPSLLHYRQILHRLSHQGSPIIAAMC